MKKPATTKTFCRECGQTTWHQIVASLNRREIEGEEDPPIPPVWADVVYDFLQCCGCDCVTMRSTLTCEKLYQDDKWFDISRRQRRGGNRRGRCSFQCPHNY
jgi:hypothetical protein